MDKLKVKLIGVLKERGGTVNANNKQQVGVGMSHTNGAAQDHITNGVEDETREPLTSGAARTTVLARPQSSKLSPLDVAGILNTRRRLEWTKEWLRKNQTEFLSKENILSELQFRNNECYHLNYFLTITEKQFRILVQKLDPVISQYAPQRKKKSFSAEERLSITLKYLATGEVHSCRNYCFRASKPVIFRMIANICLSFYNLLEDQYLKLPKTEEQWQRVSNEMQRKHELSNCVGNLFMREIQFHSSICSDERKQAPLIFSGVIDSENNFQHIDVEFTPAKAHNEMYQESSIKNLLEQVFKLSSANVNNNQSNDSLAANGCGYFFIGDNTLPTTSYVVTAQNTDDEFNKKLEQINARTDQALRILCNMFPILAQPMRINAQHTRDLVLGCVALYNFLRKTDDTFLQRSNNIVKQPWESAYMEEYHEDSDDDCIMLATEEELRERAEFTPSIGLTTCFQSVCLQKGTTAEGMSKRHWLQRSFNDQWNGTC